MKFRVTYVASALIFFALVASCAVVPAHVVTPTLESRALADACRLSGYDCEGVEPPILRYADFYASGNIGAYFGGRIVYVSETLASYPDELYLTLVHEAVHYLQWRVGGSGTIFSILHLCVLEQEAYRVTTALAVEMGMGHLAKDESADPRCRKTQPATKVFPPELRQP